MVQQARTADAAQSQTWLSYDVAKMVLWGTILGFLTLIAASLAAFYAREAAKSFVEAERPNLVIHLQNFVYDDFGRIAFYLTATNVGAKGCVVVGVFHIWAAGGEKPEILLGHSTPTPIPAGETKSLDPIMVTREAILKEPFLMGAVRYEGPFIKKDDVRRFRFKVYPEISQPHLTSYHPSEIVE